jgi:hypothetical protein
MAIPPFVLPESNMDHGISIVNSFLPYGELVAENNRLIADNAKLVADNAKLVEDNARLVEEKRSLNEEKYRLHIENGTLRGDAEEAKIALVAVKNRAEEDESKYFDLVSIAHGYPPRTNKYIDDPMQNIDPMWKVGDWNGGFNSGMLAATRLYRGLAVSTEEETFYSEDDEEVKEELQRHRQLTLRSFPYLYLDE